MNKFGLLASIQLKESFARLSGSIGIKGKKTGLILVPLLLIAFSSISIQMSWLFHSVFKSIGAPELMLTVMYLFTCLFVFFISMTSVTGTLFYSKDTAFYASLPVKETSVVFSKLTMQYLVSLAVTAVFFGPSMAVYWLENSVRAQSYIYGAILLLTAPLIPVLAASLLVMLLMKTVSRASNRNALSIIFNIILIIAILGIQILVSRQAADEELIKKMMEDDGLLGIISRGFPPSLWATRMFLGSTASAAYFIAANTVIAAVLWLTSVPLFRKAVRSFAEGASVKPVKNGSLLYRYQKPMASLVKRQLLMIIKTPAFVLNISMLILLPFILIVIWSFSGFDAIQQMLGGRLGEYTPYIYILLLSSPALMGTFSATAITREGRYLWQIKSLPVTPQTDLLSRIYTSLALCLAGLVPMTALSLFLLEVSFPLFITGLTAAVIISASFSVLDLLIDIFRPILNWTNPTQAIKNNMNILMALLLRVLLGLMIFAARDVWMPFGAYARILAFTVFMIIIGSAAGYYIVRYGTQKYSRIDI